MIVQVSIMSTKNLSVEDREAIEQLIASRDDGGVGVGVIVLDDSWDTPYTLWKPEQPINLSDPFAVIESRAVDSHCYLIGNQTYSNNYVINLRKALHKSGLREAYRPRLEALPLEQRTEFWW